MLFVGCTSTMVCLLSACGARDATGRGGEGAPSGVTQIFKMRDEDAGRETSRRPRRAEGRADPSTARNAPW